jgi:hypothetical protein
MSTDENYSVLDSATLASIFGRIVDDIDVYDSHELAQYATGQGLCNIDRYLIALVGNAAPTKNLSMKYKQLVRTNFRKYLRAVLGLDGDDVTDVPEISKAVTAKTVECVSQSEAVDGGVGFKAFRNRAVLNRGRPFPSYEKARQYIRRHITAHIGADTYNGDTRITTPVDETSRNYPNITAIGYRIRKAA